MRTEDITPALYLFPTEMSTAPVSNVIPIVANVPSKDLVEPECIADTILYLLSDMSCSMTGQCLVIDGGASVCGY